MEKLAKCKNVIGIYRNDNIILGGPHVIEFKTSGEYGVISTYWNYKKEKVY